MENGMVIIGFGTAAVNAAVSLRRNGYTGPIDVFSTHDHLPISPVVVSYFAGERLPEEKCSPWDADLIEELDLTVHEKCPVTRLNVDAHEVETAEGTFPYAKCLIATGSKNMTYGWPYDDGVTPLTLRSLEDGKKLKAALEMSDSPRILCSGASMVAMKTVEACLARGVKCAVVGMNNRVLETSCLPEISPLYQQALSDAGVDLYLGRTVKKAVHAQDGTIDITLSDGTQLNFDAVLCAHGMRAELGFVEEGTLDMDRGLLVDHYMRTSNPDVYAAGDVTQAVDVITGRPLVIATWISACDQGRAAGTAMACDFAGTACPEGSEFKGCLRSNTVNVGTITLISGGDVFCPDSRVEVSQKDDITIATVHEQLPDGSERLIGYNVFCANAQPGSRAYDEGAHLLRRMRAAL